MNLFINFFTHSPLAQAVGLEETNEHDNVFTNHSTVCHALAKLEKKTGGFRIYYVKSISGTSNPEYIVGSISDSQVRLY
ncbi:hypothetical protein T08_13993 [Trichinella sp. T8]|nr:hypothetical protein T08_13993 [Trichinella sp. T8]